MIRKVLFAFYLIFILLSIIFNFKIGIDIGKNFLSFAFSMLKIVPVAFILIGLFEVWIKRETIEKHLGEDSNWKGYFWALMLSATTVGGIYVALPVSASLYHKGAKLSVIFTYIGAAAVARIPMTIFEASFLGLKFTLVRFFVSIPLIIISSILLGKYLTGSDFRISLE